MDALVTRQEAADILHLSVARVRQLEASGELTKFKNKRTGDVRYRHDQVLALKRDRETWHAVAV
jgi:phage terminase Nu1 subunit (DNA packaging protein)